MDKREAMKLKVGNTIRLKHHLGNGLIRRIAYEYEEGVPEGPLPMFIYSDVETKRDHWCTYKVIQPRSK